MKTLLSGLLLLCSLGSNAADVQTMKVDAGKPSFVIMLAANPTTGYQWTVKKYDTTVFKLTNSLYIAPQTNLVGAGGQMQYTFELNKGQIYPKTAKFLFNYARSWEPSSGSVKQVTVNFTHPKTR